MKQEMIAVPKNLLAQIKAFEGRLEATERTVGMLASKAVQHDRSLRDIEEEYPLLPPEADDLSKTVKRKGCEILGGRQSNAYADRELRTRVYRDIYMEIKRNYGLIDEKGVQQSYKKLKRKYLTGALSVINQYIAPIAIQNDIEALNDLED